MDLAVSVKPWVWRKKALILIGFKECIRQIEELNEYNKADPDSDEPMHWCHSMGNKPANTEGLVYAYINILSKIRYRAKIVEFQSAPKGKVLIHEFNDGRKREGKHWLYLHEFEKLDPEIKMGGFQGFRYWNPGKYEI